MRHRCSDKRLKRLFTGQPLTPPKVPPLKKSPFFSPHP